MLPCIAGHVGADAAGMVLAERPDLGEQMTLLVDVGTNAEIVLGNTAASGRLFEPDRARHSRARRSAAASAPRRAPSSACASTATRSSRASRSSARICGRTSPAFAEATAASGITGVCGSGIIEVIAEMYLAGIINQDGVLDGRLAARSPRIVANGRTFAYVLHQGAVEMKITQNDVRAIQLAKAALYAGVALLMERLGIEHVDRIRLAGAFGSHIDVKYATILGMIPDCDLKQVRSAGNAAGTGARIALLDATSRERHREPWSGASRKWRLRSSRAFSTISSRPWRFRTRPPRMRICARSSICPRPRNPPARPRRADGGRDARVRGRIKSRCRKRV